MTRHRGITSLGLTGAALALTIGTVALAQQPMTEADPTVPEIHAGDTIHAAQLPDHIYLRSVNDPDDIIWDRIPTYRTLLTAAPPVHPSTLLRFDPEGGEHLYFQLARTAERFYVRLRWQDPTQNRKTIVNEFRDGAAIQFALNGVDTSYMMGSGPEKPVNIWYWRSDRDEVEDLAAGGYGSTTTLPEQSVTGQAVYHAERNKRDNEWRLVMSRKLDSSGEYQAGLQKGTIPVAFALWQGADGQRDGTKRVSHSWILVDVRPPPPPEPERPSQAPERPASAAETGANQPKEASPPSKPAPAGSGVKSKDVPKGGQFY